MLDGFIQRMPPLHSSVSCEKLPLCISFNPVGCWSQQLFIVDDTTHALQHSSILNQLNVAV